MAAIAPSLSEIAGLEVFKHGHEINPRLRELPNMVLLPHLGSATVEDCAEML